MENSEDNNGLTEAPMKFFNEYHLKFPFVNETNVSTKRQRIAATSPIFPFNVKKKMNLIHPTSLRFENVSATSTPTTWQIPEIQATLEPFDQSFLNKNLSNFSGERGDRNLEVKKPEYYKINGEIYYPLNRSSYSNSSATHDGSHPAITISQQKASFDQRSDESSRSKNVELYETCCKCGQKASPDNINMPRSEFFKIIDSNFSKMKETFMKELEQWWENKNAGNGQRGAYVETDQNLLKTFENSNNDGNNYSGENDMPSFISRLLNGDDGNEDQKLDPLGLSVEDTHISDDEDEDDEDYVSPSDLLAAYSAYYAYRPPYVSPDAELNASVDSLSAIKQ